MPFIMLTVLIDMVSIGLIIPCWLRWWAPSPATDHAFWYGAVITFAFGFASFWVADPGRAVGPATAAARCCCWASSAWRQLHRHRPCHRRCGCWWCGRSAARCRPMRRSRSLRGRHHRAWRIAPNRFRHAGRDVRHGLRARAGHRRPARRDRPTTAVLRRRALAVLNAIYGVFVLPSRCRPSAAAPTGSANPLTALRRLRALHGIGALVG